MRPPLRIIPDARRNLPAARANDPGRPTRPRAWFAGPTPTLGILLLAAAVILLSPACRYFDRIDDSDIRRVQVDDVQLLLYELGQDDRAVVLVDTRSTAAYDAGHLPGAVHVELPDVPANGGRYPLLDGRRRIVVYGQRAGSASAKAMTKRLMHVGHSGVVMFDGGVEAWTRVGLALEGETDFDTPQG